MDKPWEWMYKYANSWRTGPDHHDDWKSTATIIEVNADLGEYAGIVYRIDSNNITIFEGPDKGWNDPDFLMTGGQVT